MREVTIERPVTPAKLAEVLGCRPFEILAALIKRSLFLTPDQVIEDEGLAIELATQWEVFLSITGEIPPDELHASGLLPLHPSRQFPPGHFGSGPDPDTLSPDED